MPSHQFMCERKDIKIVSVTIHIQNFVNLRTVAIEETNLKQLKSHEISKNNSQLPTRLEYLHDTGDKPLSETIMVKYTDAYVVHSVPLCRNKDWVILICPFEYMALIHSKDDVPE